MAVSSKVVLPFPPEDYDAHYFNAMVRVLNVFFQQQMNPGPINGSTLNLSSLPTSSAGLRSGDIWVDTTAAYVLKRVP
jgi:hypothetical protein